MRKAYTLLIFSVWLVILPYLGFPYFWKDILTTFSGVCLIITSYMLYKEFRIREIEKKDKVFDNFSENSDFTEKEIEQDNSIQN